MSRPTADDLAAAYRRAWPSLIGQLVRDYGSLELAEDCVQEAAARALDAGPLRDPIAWVATVARRLAVDELRKEQVRRRKAPLLAEPAVMAPTAPATTGDDRLDLLVLACHPVLPAGSRMPLALRFVLGVPTEALADAFGVEHQAMSARLTRAKRRLDAHGRRFDPPGPGHRGEVYGEICVLYTLGHTALAGPLLGREADRSTAVELARAAARAWPADPEAKGLVALLLLTEARTPGRRDTTGRPVTLREADRASWDARLVSEGLGLAAEALPSMGRFALQAGIAGLHSAAPTWEETDWPAVVALYDRLLERWPSPGAAVARAVAIGYGEGPEAGLAALERVPGPFGGALARQVAAARADLLRLAGRTLEARAAYGEALTLERNQVLRDFLTGQLAELAG
ncbi:MAG: DUF6596 domain-containing protein [Propionicimonas sp.]|nr:sigma factor [Propionicimonas sp.]